MKRNNLIRIIYLYLATLIGLVLIIIGAVNFINMGLKTFIFTKAEEDQRYGYEIMTPGPPIRNIEKLEEDERLSEEEIELIKMWLSDYKDWKERTSKIDYVIINRHRDASINLALILVGLPLYIYHWRIIRKESKNKVE